MSVQLFPYLSGISFQLPFLVLPSGVMYIPRASEDPSSEPLALQVHRQRSLEVEEQVWKAFGDSYSGRVEAAGAPGDHFFYAYYHTQRLIADPKVRVILGPAFFWRDLKAEPFDPGIGVRAGALVRRRDGTFKLVDLKAVTSLHGRRKRVNAKGEVTTQRPLNMGLVNDLAIRVAVARASGIEISKAAIMHLSGEAAFEGGDVVDPATLLHEAKLTGVVERLQADVPAKIQELQAQHPRPRREDSEPVPDTHITRLYSARDNLLARLRVLGIEDIRDIPDSYGQHEDDVALSPIQRRQVAALKSGEMVVEEPAELRRKLERILERAREPGARLSLFDVETIQPKLALIRGTKNGELLTLQFSNHFMEADGRIQHTEFLYDGDPQAADAAAQLDKALAEATLESVGPAGPILVWKSSYEKGRLRELAARLWEQGEETLAAGIDALTSDGTIKALAAELARKGQEEYARQLKSVIGHDYLVRDYIDYLRKPKGRGKKATPPPPEALELAGQLEEAMANERIVDLLPIVRDHIYHPELGASFSIKSVLEVFFPERAYGTLEEIQNGDIVTKALEEYLDPRTEPDRRAEIIRKALLYCRHDTAAEVWILEKLFEIAGLAWPFTGEA